MKCKRLSMLFGITVGIIFFAGFPNDARGADWVHYANSAIGDMYFYDKDSIHNISGGVIRVWTRTVFSDAGRAEVIRKYRERGISANRYELLREEKSLCLLNCKDESYTLTEGIEYAVDGETLTSWKREGDWLVVVPDSFIESLMKIVCAEKAKQKEK